MRDSGNWYGDSKKGFDLRMEGEIPYMNNQSLSHCLARCPHGLRIYVASIGCACSGAPGWDFAHESVFFTHGFQRHEGREGHPW
jgi:hypothetical protein